MDNGDQAALRTVVRERLKQQAAEIDRSLRQIAAGNPLGSEPRPERLVARLSTKTGLPERDVKALATTVIRKAAVVDQAPVARTRAARESAAEALQGPTVDFVGIEFLTRGRLAANTVGRVCFRSGQAQGSGFLVGPGLFLTNNHVVPSADHARQMVVEFDYENDDDGRQRPVTTFALDPDQCFINEPTMGLDFALVALGPCLSGEKPLEAFGFNPLSDAKDKHMLGEIANIIQHPLGRLKQLVVRENNLISRDETHQVLHYLADTDHGASGSPVHNNEWEPIALHHWGEPALEATSLVGQPLRSDVNEGVRISAIVQRLKARAGGLQGSHATSLKRLLDVWAGMRRSGPVGASTVATEVIAPRVTDARREAATGISQRTSADGTVTWTIPLEVSVRLPSVPVPAPVPAPSPAPEAPPAPTPKKGEKASTDDFEDRNGYEPGFIPGHVIPLPDTAGVGYRLARNQQALHGDDPHELRYYNFSVVMNADRRLCAFTACNIDGRRVVYVNRDKKTTKVNPTPKDLGVESMEGAESSDDFSPDPRVSLDEQMGQAFYKDQKVPGFDKPKFPADTASDAEKKAYYRAMNERTARMFQKGHMTLRGDPAWGTEDQAVLAEADTFFYTNAAPQLGFFNQGSPEDHPAAKGKLRWRAIESYVLRNAVTSRARVSVFAGPVFNDATDPPYRFDSQVPMQFWKIVVWKATGGLRALALLASQQDVLDRLTEGVPEALLPTFDTDGELARVSEFLSTVARIEELTGLRFSNNVREADIRAGQGSESLTDVAPQALTG